jgi:hypothetical protein
VDTDMESASAKRGKEAKEREAKLRTALDAKQQAWTQIEELALSRVGKWATAAELRSALLGVIETPDGLKLYEAYRSAGRSLEMDRSSEEG